MAERKGRRSRGTREPVEAGAGRAERGGRGPTMSRGAGSPAHRTTGGDGTRADRLRSQVASLVWALAVLAACLLALGAFLTALDHVNRDNSIVSWVLDRGHQLVGPFRDLVRLETAKNTLLANWGIAALVYLAVGKLVEQLVRPQPPRPSPGTSRP